MDVRHLVDQLDWLMRKIYDSEEIQENDAALVKQAINELSERKIGHWIVLDKCSNEGIYCSECGVKIFQYSTKPKQKLSNYCPNCGARNSYFYNPSTKKYMD